jgi:competence protein ComEA
MPPVPDLAVPVWPRSAQICGGSLLALALGLVAWHAFLGHRLACRPLDIEAEGVALDRVDLNSADLATLRQVQGIGPALAGRILESRDRDGPFRDVDDLQRVKGFGPATLERLRPFLQVGNYEEDAEQARPGGKKKGKAQARGLVGGKKLLKGPLDINQATLAELQQLPGIGPALSQRIVDERDEAPFESVDDLRRVSGIGAKKLETLRPHVFVRND